MTKIAVDGPAGAGKSSISKEIAKKLGYVYIDTGAMYRTVGLKAVREGVDTKNEEKLSELVKNIDIDIRCEEDGQIIFLDGEDVSALIRTPEISMAASNVSAVPQVRVAMVELQRKLAKNHNVVMDGRDIASHVLPDAEVKIYLTASAEARGERRCKELREKGENVSLEEVISDIKKRDKNDMTRAASPLVIAEGAKVIDTSMLNLKQSLDAVYSYICDCLRK